jgi:hypothetical protein
VVLEVALVLHAIFFELANLDLEAPDSLRQLFQTDDHLSARPSGKGARFLRAV